eukprot:CAMPEP_0172455566 /NCGR_PEP_ID=MMETSP1065-20121228/12128_1 /TAXON_ID=265537 /ORGANISM="Amphiprora paludosa, Strain CCMP125" /LENGTH=375 /DNA_ID=CAMNT_0013208031 /DNA_START=90 /DNA_END=1217 /DNA_ORIENTATION=+
MTRKSSTFLAFCCCCALWSTRVVDAFQIGQLLSTCVDACQKGCVEVRKVQAARGTGGGDLYSDETGLQVEFKDENDSRSALTEADKAAHRAIVGSLRAEWGDTLQIVSEEDEHDTFLADQEQENSFAPLKRDLFDDDMGEETADIDPADVTIFVDPVDGTREFVEGRLENCQVLVGMAIKGEAVAGAIGLPFPAGDLSTEETIVYGLVDLGTGTLGATLTRGPFPLERHIDGIKYPRPHLGSSDADVEVMRAARQGVLKRFGGSNVIYGGAGNKILAAALGEVSCSIQHKIGGPWDLCAPEAILKAMGGKMTDFFGNEMEIYQKNGLLKKCNERGYIATPPGAHESYHSAIAETLMEVPEVQKYRDEVMAGVPAS